MPLFPGPSQAKECPFSDVGPKGHRRTQALDELWLCSFFKLAFWTILKVPFNYGN